MLLRDDSPIQICNFGPFGIRPGLATKRVPAILETLPYEFRRAVSVLNDALGDREFFLGERFTMVDIFLAHTLRWAKNFEFQLEHAALEDYLTRMEARPAFERMLKSEKLPFRP